MISVKDNNEILVLMGQGEGETKWKGCRCTFFKL